MSDSGTKINNTVNQLPQSFSNFPQAERKPSNIVDKEDFLKLLVTQLKHQDPLDPVSNDRFAVDLAQFTQVEQLIAINDKLKGKDDAKESFSALSSMASFLGHDVVIPAGPIKVESGDGGFVRFNIPKGSTDAQVSLFDSAGGVAHRINLEAKDGQNRVDLKDLDVSDGEYTVRVTAKNNTGALISIVPQIGGAVTGFIPGPNGALIVNGREVRAEEIIEVIAGVKGQ